MRAHIANIVALRDSHLISFDEARTALKVCATRAQYDADYSDSPASYNRWTAIAQHATRTLAAL